ncbi:hypothetical protein V8E53_014563 [Lactarius tabidus]
MMSLLTFVFFYVLTFVHALPLAKRIVVSPQITSPTATTIWTVGNQVTVTWDTSNIPPPGNFTGQLVLGYLTSGSSSENLDVDNPLAANFLLSAGSVQITVPNVPTGTNYIVVLFGDSGNASPQFTITGGSSTTPTPSPSSTSTPVPATPTTPTPTPVSPDASSSPTPPPPGPSTSTSTPVSPNRTNQGLPDSSSSSGTTTTTSAPGSTNTPSNPESKSSSSNSALQARGASTMFLCAVAGAISLVLVL